MSADAPQVFPRDLQAWDVLVQNPSLTTRELGDILGRTKPPYNIVNRLQQANMIVGSHQNGWVVEEGIPALVRSINERIRSIRTEIARLEAAHQALTGPRQSHGYTRIRKRHGARSRRRSMTHNV